MFVPLYPPEGGPAVAFKCLICPAEDYEITRTQRGMKTHCWRVHKVKIQLDLPLEELPDSERENCNATSVS